MSDRVDPNEAFAQSGLNALLGAAARSCPDAILIRDDAEGIGALVLAHRVRSLADAFRSAGLVPGERVLVVAAAQASAIVATIAALAAGLEPALMHPGLGPVEIAAHAMASGAVALVGPSHLEELNVGEAYLTAAALADTVRLVATQGPEPVDGALDLSFPAARQPSNDDLPDTATLEALMIATFAGPATSPRLQSHRQVALFSDALSLIEQAKINPSKCVLSLVPPASVAGLVAGPFAALIGASSLVLHGPFSAARFLAAMDAEPGCHLVVPARLGPLFAESRLSASLSSLILVSRFETTSAFERPETIACERPIADVYAFGEETVLAQRRHDGEARPPSRVVDRSLTDGLGAKLNRARAELRPQSAERG